MTRMNRPAGGLRRQETGPSGPTRTYGRSVVDFNTPLHRTGLDLSTPSPQTSHTGGPGGAESAAVAGRYGGSQMVASASPSAHSGLPHPLV
jgi:hypothetical protein